MPRAAVSVFRGSAAHHEKVECGATNHTPLFRGLQAANPRRDVPPRRAHGTLCREAESVRVGHILHGSI